jgi:YVTN family beta-propeller protein
MSVRRSLVALLVVSCGRGKEAPEQAAQVAHHPDIYAGAGAGMLDSLVRHDLPRVYVPNGGAGAVTVIDPATYQVVGTFPTGIVPQHVVPSYDLRTLWVANEQSNTLTPIDAATGKVGTNVPVDDPYNLYFTPDGKFAVVVAERLQRLDFRDAHTMALVKSVPVSCPGVDHMDYTADGRYAIATCEFCGKLVKVDVAAQAVVGYLVLDSVRGAKGTPQDIRSSPDGAVFYVADMSADGVFLVNPATLTTIGFIATGVGAHGLYPSRDGKLLYVTNRGWHKPMGPAKGPGSISVIDFATRKVVANWPIAGGGSPDMGNVTADGKELWVSGRFDGEVYVFDTKTGQLTHRIPVARGPHGLTVWPQPGRYSLGHTGNMR